MKAPVALLATSLALAGCGTQAQPSSVDNFQGAEREVAQKVEDLQDAGKRNKPDDICANILATSLVDQIEEAGADCAQEMKKAIEDADDFELDVRSVKVTGDTATARVQRGDDGPEETMQFTREKGQWRATALSG
jgi:hypothetical protein